MTLGSVFGGGVTTTTAKPYLPYPPPNDFRNVISERDGSTYGYGKKNKSKFKSETKQAALSALTLLAFLFFLNILQNCLREQTQPVASEVTMMMMMPQKEMNEPQNRLDEQQPPTRKTRSLLEFREPKNRREKFIQDYREDDWTNRLSQLSEKELESHKMKTDTILKEQKPDVTLQHESVDVERYFPILRRPLQENDWVPSLGSLQNSSENEIKRSEEHMEIQTAPSYIPQPVHTFWNHRNDADLHEEKPMKVRFKPVRHPQNRHRFHPRPDAKYRYRKNGHHHYPVVIQKSPEPGFNLMEFIWSLLSGIARPLSRMIPAFEEQRCYDLLVCEAHRVSRIMGPTAEVLASTVSTFLTWYTPEDGRQTLIDAVASAKENTCQQQIIDCDERTGGKSAMTVIAQVLETKSR